MKVYCVHSPESPTTAVRCRRSTHKHVCSIKEVCYFKYIFRTRFKIKVDFSLLQRFCRVWIALVSPLISLDSAINVAKYRNLKIFMSFHSSKSVYIWSCIGHITRTINDHKDIEYSDNKKYVRSMWIFRIFIDPFLKFPHRNLSSLILNCVSRLCVTNYIFIISIQIYSADLKRLVKFKIIHFRR